MERTISLVGHLPHTARVRRFVGWSAPSQHSFLSTHRANPSSTFCHGARHSERLRALATTARIPRSGSSAPAPFTDTTATSARGHRGRAGDHSSVASPAHQGSLGRLDGRPRARARPARRRRSPTCTQQFKTLGLKPGNPDGTYHPERRPHRLQGASDGVVHGAAARRSRCAYPDDFIANSRHNRDRRRRSTTPTSSSSATASSRRSTAGTTTRASTCRARRSSCSSTTPPSRRLTGDRRHRARPDDVQGQGDDVLRPLDVQVRDRLGEGRGGGDHHPRDRAGRLPVRRRADRATRRRTSTSPRPTPRSACRSRAGFASRRRRSSSRAAGHNFDSLKAAAAPQGLPARPARREGDLRREDRPRARSSRRTSSPGSRAPTRRTSTSSTPRTGTTSAATRRSRATRSSTAPPTTPRAARRCSRSRKAFTKLPDAAAALDPLPLRDGRGEGAARREVLRRRIRSIRSTKTAANINMDGINLWGRTSDFTVIGLGNSTLDDVLTRRPQGGRPHACVPTPSRRRASTTAPTTSSSPSRASPRSTPRPASTSSASPPATACSKRDEYTEQRLPQAVATR